MIDHKRFENLSFEALKSVAEFADAMDCEGVQCTVCPFELASEKGERFRYTCALAYGKALYMRATK